MACPKPPSVDYTGQSKPAPGQGAGSKFATGLTAKLPRAQIPLLPDLLRDVTGTCYAV